MSDPSTEFNFGSPDRYYLVITENESSGLFSSKTIEMDQLYRDPAEAIENTESIHQVLVLESVAWVDELLSQGEIDHA